MKKMILKVSVILITLMSIMAYLRAAYETAAYKVVEQDGVIEIRDYPELMLASTETSGDVEGRDGSFMRLFRYISGANDKQQKVSMTTPVFMEPAAQDRRAKMGFVVPEDVAARGAPQPTAGDVVMRTRSAGRFAVIRFSGRMDAKSISEAERKLREWASKKGLQLQSSVEFAGYDAPMTPGPLRRNEVLIQLQKPI